LGFTCRARRARTKQGKLFVCFQPAISKDARTKFSVACQGDGTTGLP